MSSSSMPQSAIAWQYDRKGKITETLQKREIKLRALKAGEVLIKVHAAALNPVDWKMAQLLPGLIAKLPRIAAADFAGEVIFVNEEKETPELKEGWVKRGARVYGILPAEECIKTGEGTLTTYLIARHDQLGPIPEKMTYEKASGLSLTGLTAATIVSQVEKGNRVLILGGTTSVGLMALQMCKAEQASLIVATCSERKASAAKENGADEIINYRDVNVVKQLEEKYGSNKFDIILDTVGSFDTYRACPSFLQSKGIYLNVGASSVDTSKLLRSMLDMARNNIRTMILPARLGGTPRRYNWKSLEAKRMPDFRQMVSSDAVKPIVDSVFPFDDAPKAYEHLIKGRALGKVVVTVVEA